MFQGIAIIQWKSKKNKRKKNEDVCLCLILRRHNVCECLKRG